MQNSFVKDLNQFSLSNKFVQGTCPRKNKNPAVALYMKTNSCKLKKSNGPITNFLMVRP